MTMPGEFCGRCGAKSTINIEPAPEGGADVQVYRCPNGHGIQRITPVATEPPAETETDHEDGEAGDTEGAHIPTRTAAKKK
jgi:hypothetical protein